MLAALTKNCRITAAGVARWNVRGGDPQVAVSIPEHVLFQG